MTMGSHGIRNRPDASRLTRADFDKLKPPPMQRGVRDTLPPSAGPLVTAGLLFVTLVAVWALVVTLILAH